MKVPLAAFVKNFISGIEKNGIKFRKLKQGINSFFLIYLLWNFQKV